MTRLALVILITGAAFVALIIFAGRMDWYAVSVRMSSDAIDAFDAFTEDERTADDERTSDAASGTVATLSDPSTWNADFMRDARPTDQCPTDTVGNVRARMAAVGPYTVSEYERTVSFYTSNGDEPGQGIPTYNRVSYPVRSSITAADRVYAYGFNAGDLNTGAREVSGYFVARDDCLVHVEAIVYDR